ncbi:vacuolar membrane protein-domain-containing protein, partial [Flammula alnicola]
DVDQPSCQLLGPTALIVQGLMGVLVILSLVYKRHRETPKRPWRIWFAFDVSKQVVGQLFVHGTNLLVSGLVSDHTSGNACVSYFLNILIDTTFGIALIYVTLHALTHLFTEKFQIKGFESGVYGTPPSISYWARQAALYILSLSTMKAVVITFLVLFPGIYVAGKWLLSWTWTGNGDALQVIFVMGIFPILMNILQFWLIDSIVKASSVAGPPLDVEHGAYEDREPLFQAPLEDGDDDDPPSKRNVSDSRHHRGSISSLDSREHDANDSHSFATDTTSRDEYKSSASSSRQVSDIHGYPPSLSSSFSSNASTPAGAKSPREAKNLMKKTKRREPPTPLHMRPTRDTQSSSSPSSIPVTPSPRLAPAAIAQDHAEWTESWDGPNEWERENHKKQNSLPTSGEWNTTHPTIP